MFTKTELCDIILAVYDASDRIVQVKAVETEDGKSNYEFLHSLFREYKQAKYKLFILDKRGHAKGYTATAFYSDF